MIFQCRINFNNLPMTVAAEVVVVEFKVGSDCDGVLSVVSPSSEK